MPRFAFGQTRATLPGGGTVMIPRPYKTETDYPNYARDIDDAVIAYRTGSTMSGHPECDGMLGVGRRERFSDLAAFVRTCRPLKRGLETSEARERSCVAPFVAADCVLRLTVSEQC